MRGGGAYFSLDISYEMNRRVINIMACSVTIKYYWDVRLF